EPKPRAVQQDFGFSSTHHAGGGSGEMGGLITPAAEPAYYARRIKSATLNEPLSASGLFSCGEKFHVLIAFFHTDSLKEWRTPNTIALRVSGRGDVFYAWVEYATGQWRAGGDSPRGFPTEADPQSGRLRLKGFPGKGKTHRWSLLYDPKGNDGRGVITASIDD